MFDAFLSEDPNVAESESGRAGPEGGRGPDLAVFMGREPASVVLADSHRHSGDQKAMRQRSFAIVPPVGLSRLSGPICDRRCSCLSS